MHVLGEARTGGTAAVSWFFHPAKMGIATYTCRSLTHIVNCLYAKAQWDRGSAREAETLAFAGDIVQAIQALKESRPEPTEDLWSTLIRLLSSLAQFELNSDDAATGPLYSTFSRAEAQIEDALYVLYPDKARVFDQISPRAAAHIAVDIPSQSKLETFQLGPYRFPRLLNGLWQLASPAWGSESSEKQADPLGKILRSGLVATDMADHYVGFINSRSRVRFRVFLCD